MRIAIKFMGLSPRQQELNARARCYAGTMWADRDEKIPWARKFDELGNYIPREKRVPSYIDNLGKEIVKDVSASVAGADKFPAITISTSKDIFAKKTEGQEDDGSDKDNIEGDSDKGAKEVSDKRQAEISDQLQELLDSLKETLHLEQRVLKAVSRALAIEASYVMFKVVEGRPKLEIIDCTWIKKVKYDPKHPGRVTYLEEMYVTEDDDVNPKDGRPPRFWHRRVIDDKGEYKFKVPYDYERESRGEPPKAWGQGKATEHKFGFCPVIEFTNDRESLLAAPTWENIKAYIEQAAEVDASLDEQLDPQRYILQDHNVPGKQKSKTLMRGKIWELKGKSVGQLNTDTGGIQSGFQRLAEKRDQIKTGCHVIESINDDNQQSGIAIQRRFTPKLNYLASLRTNFGEGIEALIDLIFHCLVKINSRNEKIYLKSDKDLELPTGTEFTVSLSWGELLPPSAQDKQLIMSMASMGRQEGFWTSETAAKMVHQLFGIKDTQGELERVEQEREEAQKKQMEMFGQQIQTQHRMTNQAEAERLATHQKMMGQGPKKPLKKQPANTNKKQANTAPPLAQEQNQEDLKNAQDR